MSAIHELGSVVRTRRSTMGISQAALARMSGLSRATVNGVEQGTVRDLSLLRATRLLNVLGMNMAIAPARQRRREAEKSSALQIAARTASTSFRDVISASELRRVLTSAMPSTAIEPHIRTLLEEAPVSLLAAVAEELLEEGGIPAAVSWKRMRDLAWALGAMRDIWS